MSELRDECGVAAIYHLPGKGVSPLCQEPGPEGVSRLMPRMLLDIQNRGQLAAGMTTYNAHRPHLLDTYKDVGTVCEVFRMNHRAKFENLMKGHVGRAAIGHVRYATCGGDDRSYAQPFERQGVIGGMLRRSIGALGYTRGAARQERALRGYRYTPDLSRAFL